MGEQFVKKATKQFIMFAIIGSFSTVVNYLIFYILLKWGLYYLVSSAVGFLTGFFISFTFNKKYTFASRGNTKAEIIKYFLVVLFSLGASLLLLRFLVSSLLINSLIANIFSIGLSTILNFTGAKFIVFKRQV